MPRPPTFDHKKKKPLEKRVIVFLDDAPIEALEEARGELEDAEATATEEYERRLKLARNAPSIPSAAEILSIEAGLDGARAEKLTPYREAVAAAEEAVRATSQEFVFRSPKIERDGKEIRGRRAFETLVAEHEPADEDHDDARKMTGQPEALAGWHSDTFIPALISACAATPTVTVEQATEMYEEWNDAEVGDLFAAALLVSRGARQVDLGKSSRAASKRG